MLASLHHEEGKYGQEDDASGEEERGSSGALHLRPTIAGDLEALASGRANVGSGGARAVVAAPSANRETSSARRFERAERKAAPGDGTDLALASFSGIIDDSSVGSDGIDVAALVVGVVLVDGSLAITGRAGLSSVGESNQARKQYKRKYELHCE